MTYRECYEQGKKNLKEAGILEADLDARLLLEYVCGTNRNDLLVHGDRTVLEDDFSCYQKLIEKRKKRVPLQYLTGEQEFMGLSFLVNEQVLIPRQDTEILVEEVLKELHDGMTILDMCTGSGCILLSLLRYSNECKGVGVDISRRALEIAVENTKRLFSEKVLDTENMEIMEVKDGSFFVDCNQVLKQKDIAFVESNLFEKITGKFDILVSNPPYIRTEVISSLMPEVREYEPIQALDGREDGLFFYRKIVEESKKYLMGGGRLYFEIGYDQAKEVSSLMEKAGFLKVTVVKDLGGLDRVVYGILPSGQ